LPVNLEKEVNMTRMKSTAEKLLAGNPGKRPLNELVRKVELTYETPSTYDPPEVLVDNQFAVEYWNYMAPQLINSGILTVVDVPLFIGLCESYAAMRIAQEKLNAEGLVVEGARGHELILSPWYKVYRQAKQDFFVETQRFGLSPIDRAKMPIEQPVNTEYDIEATLRGE
jgi:P27 family predicted phage terminase small subunit